MKAIRVLLFLCLSSVCYIYGQSIETDNATCQPDSFGIDQDCTNPLKGFSTFVFSADFPGATKQEVDKINETIKKCLASFGKVVPSSLIIEEEGREAIDFRGMASGCFLRYEISDLMDLKGKKLGILKATLTLNTGIDIYRTRRYCLTGIWSESCFLKGNTEKKLDDSISKSLRCLLEGFQREYLLGNEEKPVFNLYQS